MMKRPLVTLLAVLAPLSPALADALDGHIPHLMRPLPLPFLGGPAANPLVDMAKTAIEEAGFEMLASRGPGCQPAVKEGLTDLKQSGKVNVAEILATCDSEGKAQSLLSSPIARPFLQKLWSSASQGCQQAALSSATSYLSHQPSDLTAILHECKTDATTNGAALIRDALRMGLMYTMTAVTENGRDDYHPPFGYGRGNGASPFFVGPSY